MMDILIKKTALDDELKLAGEDVGAVIPELSRIFSVQNPQAFFAKQYGFSVPNKIYGVSPFGTFKVGLLADILRYLKRNYKNVNIRLEGDETKELVKSRRPLKEFVKSNRYEGPENIAKDITPRPYQIDAVDAVITKGYGRCMFECPTASGKSLIIANIIYTLFNQYAKTEPFRTLIFVPNVQLVSQLYKDLLSYGFTKDEVVMYVPKTIKKLKNSKELSDAKVVISNRQFLFNHLDEIGQIDMVIVDEVHSVAPNSKTIKILSKLKADIKIGCSGTIPWDKAKYWALLTALGPVVYQKDVIELQDDGFISQAKFTLVKVKDLIVEENPDLLFHLKSNKKYIEGEEGGIAFNDAYMAEAEHLAKHCMELYAPIIDLLDLSGANTLILFDRIEFGESLYQTLKKTKSPEFEVYYIDGRTSVDVREKIRALAETKNNVIIIAQVTTMSVGTNIKNLTNLIITGSQKSQVRTIQSIGRLLRLHLNKPSANVYDIIFNYKYSRRHYAQRRRLYKEYYNKGKPDKTIQVVLDQNGKATVR